MPNFKMFKDALKNLRRKRAAIKRNLGQFLWVTGVT